jgi:hypothetical protein
MAKKGSSSRERGQSLVLFKPIARSSFFQYRTGQTSYFDFMIIIVGRPNTINRIQKTENIPKNDQKMMYHIVPAEASKTSFWTNFVGVNCQWTLVDWLLWKGRPAFRLVLVQVDYAKV